MKQTYKDGSDYLAFKKTTWLYRKCVWACTAAFSAHSNLLYDDNKYANGTTICTSLHANSSLHVQRRWIFEAEHTCGASTAGMVRQSVVTWHFKVIKITCDLRMNASNKDIIYFKLAAIELFFTRVSNSLLQAPSNILCKQL